MAGAAAGWANSYRAVPGGHPPRRRVRAWAVLLQCWRHCFAVGGARSAAELLRPCACRAAAGRRAARRGSARAADGCARTARRVSRLLTCHPEEERQVLVSWRDPSQARDDTSLLIGRLT